MHRDYSSSYTRGKLRMKHQLRRCDLLRYAGRSKPRSALELDCAIFIDVLT